MPSGDGDADGSTSTERLRPDQEHDEASPLLGSLRGSDDEAQSGHAKLSVPPEASSWHWISIVSLGIVITILFDTADYLGQAPRIRLYESIACQRYYEEKAPWLIGRNGTLPERLCKIDPVQDTVAMILGQQYLFDSLPGLLLAVPFGMLADTHGRKLVALLAFGGACLATAWVLLAVRVHLFLDYRTY